MLCLFVSKIMFCSVLCCYEFDVGYKDVGQGPLGVFRGGGGGGDDNLLDSTLLMVYVQEVSYVLLRCAFFVVHELIRLLLRSKWFMYMK